VALRKGKHFTGAAYQLHPDGWLQSEIEYVDGVRDGMARYYFTSGQVKSEIFARRNLAWRLERDWRENGWLQREAVYVFDLLVYERAWDHAGAVVRDYEISERDPNYARFDDARARYRWLAGGTKTKRAMPDDRG
jgi:antitoxin component YwqK of YwqJK toxin-antitoxin module